MKSRLATTTTCSAILHSCVVQSSVTYAVVMICTGLFLCSPCEAAAALPTVDEFREALHISEADKQRILEGKIVDWSPSEGSDRELALGMAFLAKTTPEYLAEMYRQAVITKQIPV